MKSFIKTIAVLALAASLSACGTFSSVPLQNPPQRTKPALTERDQTAFTKEALRWVGRPYRYGGSNPASGFDCSGLVYYSALVTRGGVPPRTVADQFNMSKPVPISSIRPGDLLFYQISKNTADHVGIYVGNSSFVHAPQTGGVVRVVDMRNSYWTKRFVGARRLEG